MDESFALCICRAQFEKGSSGRGPRGFRRSGPTRFQGAIRDHLAGEMAGCRGSLTALLIGAFYAYILATRLYHATAVLRLLLEQEQIIDFPNGAGRLSGNRAELNSEVEVLRGRVLLAQVVERLSLASDVEFSARFRPEEAQRVQDEVISKLLKAVIIRNIPQSGCFMSRSKVKMPAKPR